MFSRRVYNKIYNKNYLPAGIKLQFTKFTTDICRSGPGIFFFGYFPDSGIIDPDNYLNGQAV